MRTCISCGPLRIKMHFILKVKWEQARYLKLGSLPAGRSPALHFSSNNWSLFHDKNRFFDPLSDAKTHSSISSQKSWVKLFLQTNDFEQKKNSQIITFQSHWVFFADESQITATGSQKCHQRLKFFWDFLEKQFEEISTKPDVRRRRQQNDVFIDLSKATETKKLPKRNRKRPKQSKLFFQMFRKPIFLSGA